MTVFTHSQTTNKLVNEDANDSARVSGQDRKIPHTLGTNQIAGFGGFRLLASLGKIILGDPGAVSWAGRKGATKVFRHGQKSPWVPTLTGPFPNGQANAGS